MPKVLITGISGFIGSHIAETLRNSNFQIIGLKRTETDIWRCDDYKNEIQWVDIDENNAWKTKLIALNPVAIIHCAWIGVEAGDRNNWSLQAKNIDFLINLIEVAEQIDVKRFVFMGSQAEYGFTQGKVKEDHPIEANSAYGAVKLACLEILKIFCQTNRINWFWLRVFSLFGEKENINWLIPSVIRKMKGGGEMDFTEGEQKYAYMYIKDFSFIISQIIKKDIDSGIYNISSNHPVKLKDLLGAIMEKVNPQFKMNFGALAYRSNQSMHIEGDSSKLFQQLGDIKFTDFNVALQATINFYLK